jgi:hypothetical protein
MEDPRLLDTCITVLAQLLATCVLKAKFTNKEMLSIIHFVLINKKVKEQRLNVLVFSSPNIVLSPLSAVTSLVYIL